MGGIHLPSFLDFDFKTSPHLHQLRECEEHGDDEARAMAWTMRTGKSKTAIDRAFYLFARGLIDAVLVIAPNGVHANWVEREFPIHAWDGVSWSALTWRSKVVSTKAGNKLGIDKTLDWQIEREQWYQALKAGMKTRELFVLAIATETMIRKDVRNAVARLLRNRRVLLVVDESDDFGTPGSTRTKMIRSMRKKCPYRIIMSGTMVTANPLAAWSQYEILAEGALGFAKYAAFKAHFAEYETAYSRHGKYPKLVGFKNLDELRERIAAWSSVVLRSDVKMSRPIPEDIEITPTDEQREAYETLRESFILALEAGEISVGERAPRFQKMQQVFSGFVNDEYKSRHILKGANPRLDATAHQCFLAPGKFIVWCEFQADIDFLTARLLKDGMKVVAYHGRISDTQKTANLKAFKHDATVDGLVGQWQAGGRGLDMSEASTIINHSHTFKARLRAQAAERASKIGGGPVRIIDVIAPGPDRYILKKTKERIDIADSLAGRGLKNLLEGLAL
jgi:hypothetical protein